MRHHSKTNGALVRRSPASRDEGGFTLIELLTVIVIIVVLMGLLFPTIKIVLQKAEASKAQTAIAGLETAFKAYYTEYGKWPIAYPGVPPGYEDFIVDKAMVALLSGDDVGASVTYPAPPPAQKDTGSGSPYVASTASIQRNPRKIVFLEFKQADIDASGAFVDPWKKPYHFRLDVNYANQVEYPFSTTVALVPTVGFLIWSVGPDGQYNQSDIVLTAPPLPLTVTSSALNKDNVRSW